MNSKTIWDYFEENIEFPSEVVHNPIPYGTVWSYVSSAFLNGLINYTKPFSCFVLDRYTALDEDISLCNEEDFGNLFTKKELIKKVMNEEIEMYHTNLHCFNDDIVILAEIENYENDNKNRYIFFWFDSDVSDCCVGKFETYDSKEEVEQSVINWLDGVREENSNKTFESGYDNGILNYTKLPITFLKGWLKF